jgi:hypothetical protein
MKNILFKLLSNVFQSEINQQVKSILNQKEIDSTKINYPIGTEVIVRSNEPQDLVIGTVVGYQQLRNKCLLLIKNNKTNEVIMPLDNQPAIFYKERFEALSKLNWADQWNVMSKSHYFIDTETFKYKESLEYNKR